MGWLEKATGTKRVVFVSFGGGVDSWALYFLLLSKGLRPMIDFFPIYVDHGGDLPESRAYNYRMIDKGYPLLVARPNVEGFRNIFDYYWHKQIIPFFSGKSCNAKWKIAPIERVMRQLAIDLDPQQDHGFFQLLGFNADEGYREVRSRDRFESQGITSLYPLIEEGLGRKACKELIKDHGVPVPPKSACFFCGAQSPEEWRYLRRQHPDLFYSVQLLEERSNARRRQDGLGPAYLNARCSVASTVGEGLLRLGGDSYPQPRAAVAPHKASDQEYVHYLVDLEMERRYGAYYEFCHPGRFERAFVKVCSALGVPHLQPPAAGGAAPWDTSRCGFDLQQQPRTYSLLPGIHRKVMAQRAGALDMLDGWDNLILDGMAGGMCPGGKVGNPPKLPKLPRAKKPDKETLPLLAMAKAA